MDRQTDGRTDRQTDRIAISISRVSMLTRDKKGGEIVQAGECPGDMSRGNVQGQYSDPSDLF